MFANRNGFYYTLDRTTGKLIVAKPFVQTTWAKEVGTRRAADSAAGSHAGRKGRDHLSRHHRRHELLAADLRSEHAAVLRQRARSVRDVLRVEAGIHAGRSLHRRRGAARHGIASNPAYGALRAIDPATGERKWEFQYLTPSTAGLLTTASNLIFSGDDDGNLLALDSRSGKLLWRYQMGATLHGTSPITYMLDGRQQLLVPAGTTLTAWALP